MSKYEVELTNLDKILFPKSKITKIDLIDYYKQIATHILPFTTNRALSLYRFPDGIDGQKFYQKNTPDFFPDWIKRIKVSLKTIDKFNLYTVCNNVETLVYLANYVCVPNIWLSKIDKLDFPDRLIFDLDPYDPKDFNQVRLLSLELHDILTKLGLKPFAMLTGSHGIHVIVPIKRTKGFDDVRLFAKNVAQVLVKQNPDKYTLEASLNKRLGKVFIDTLRNSFGATVVAPYAVRDKESAPIAVPISWEEVGDIALSSQRYNIHNIFDKLGVVPNPWHNFEKSAISITDAIKKLDKCKILKK